jgi:O-acetyl-ADP-ribose deacetylase (regulator of RNase III)
MEVKINNSKLSLVCGDITKQKTEAIVNAANPTLLGGGGVDGAIHRAAGPGLLEECKKLGGCKPGEAKITSGHNLFAKYVIHTVGPVWRGGGENEREVLEMCYRNSLELAEKNNIKTISFPSISTGAYRFPLKEASEIALKTVISYLRGNTKIKEVFFVLFDEKTYKVYEESLKEIVNI